jgi:hypothetical protein
MQVQTPTTTPPCSYHYVFTERILIVLTSFRGMLKRCAYATCVQMYDSNLASARLARKNERILILYGSTPMVRRWWMTIMTTRGDLHLTAGSEPSWGCGIPHVHIYFTLSGQKEEKGVQKKSELDPEDESRILMSRVFLYATPRV